MVLLAEMPCDMVCSCLCGITRTYLNFSYKDLNVKFIKDANCELFTVLSFSPEAIDEAEKNTIDKNQAELSFNLDIKDESEQVYAEVSGVMQLRKIIEYEEEGRELI